MSGTGRQVTVNMSLFNPKLHLVSPPASNEVQWGSIRWGEDEDTQFVAELAQAARYVTLTDPNVLPLVIDVISHIMHNESNLPYPKDFLYQKFYLLQQRYIIWCFVSEFPLVYYVPNTNEMRIPRLIRVALSHICPESTQYFVLGEKCAVDLVYIFRQRIPGVFDERDVYPIAHGEYFDIWDVPAGLREDVKDYTHYQEYGKIYNECRDRDLNHGVHA